MSVLTLKRRQKCGGCSRAANNKKPTARNTVLSPTAMAHTVPCNSVGTSGLPTLGHTGGLAQAQDPVAGSGCSGALKRRWSAGSRQFKVFYSRETQGAQALRTGLGCMCKDDTGTCVKLGPGPLAPFTNMLSSLVSGPGLSWKHSSVITATHKVARGQRARSQPSPLVQAPEARRGRQSQALTAGRSAQRGSDSSSSRSRHGCTRTAGAARPC